VSLDRSHQQLDIVSFDLPKVKLQIFVDRPKDMVVPMQASMPKSAQVRMKCILSGHIHFTDGIEPTLLSC
jgi:hypothetical protein